MVLTTDRRHHLHLVAAAVAAAVLVAVGTGARAQAPDDTAAYIVRGRQVEARQRALAERVAQLHEVLAASLRLVAPDLLARLDPPPPIATGYQLLPRLSPGHSPASPAAASPAPPRIVSYSWNWSETLLSREASVCDSIEAVLARGVTRGTLDSLVTEFRRLVERKKLVDADVQYNWLWQATAFRSPAVFERPTRLQQAIVEQHARRAEVPTVGDRARRAEIEAGLAEEAWRVDVPAYVMLERTASDTWTVTVPVYTDILDTTFLDEVRMAVEDAWRVDGVVRYRVRLDLRRVSPDSLYCGVTHPRPPYSSAAVCRAPAVGEVIDLAAHVARFPAGGAVLTTGAGTTHVTAGRAVVVSPHEVPRRLMAHEFGHILGFRDAYLRGAHPAGRDGFVITELVIDPTDLMGNARDGSVGPEHFERLVAAYRRER